MFLHLKQGISNQKKDLIYQKGRLESKSLSEIAVSSTVKQTFTDKMGRLFKKHVLGRTNLDSE